MPHILHHHIAGSGKPLLLIHGWAMHAGVWAGFSDRLAERCMTITPDLRGHGMSRSMAGPFPFEQHARDVAALIEQLDLRDPVLLGWSMGVSIILKMYELGCAGSAPLVLISGNPSLVRRDGYASGLAPAAVRRLYRQVGRDFAAGMQAFLGLLCTAEEHGRFSADAAYLAAMDTARWPDPAAALETLACLQTEDLRPHVPRIPVPSLVLHGECDEICLSGAGRCLAETIPGARLRMLPDTGHMPFVTRRERVLEEVFDFLDSVS